MNEIKRGTGNGQSSCYGCEQKGKWNRNWITFLYEYDGELWCEDCLIEKLNKENQELKNQQKEFIEYLENEKNRLAKECSHTYEDSLGKLLYVNEDIFNEVNKILSKYKEIIGGK